MSAGLKLLFVSVISFVFLCLIFVTKISIVLFYVDWKRLLWLMLFRLHQE